MTNDAVSARMEAQRSVGLLVAIGLAAVTTIGCEGLFSGEDDPEKTLVELQEIHGSAQFTLSGAIEGRFDVPYVSFVARTDDVAVGASWGVSVAAIGIDLYDTYDTNVTSPDLDFTPNVLVDGIGSVPAVGTYEFTGGRFLDDDTAMTGDIIFFSENDSSSRYFSAESGSFTISSRTADEVVGSIDFQAREHFDDGTWGDAVVTIEGKFRAVNPESVPTS